jgi:predicted acylesterase/phospholipase RssA
MTKGGIALFLPGGGAAGAMYQIAVLAALEDAVEGLVVNDFDQEYHIVAQGN